MRRYLPCIFAVTLLFAGSTAARAQGSSLSDSLTVYDAAGNVFASVSVDDANEDPNVIYFIDIAGLVDLSQFGNPTNLVEPDGKLSDMFGVASSDNGQTGFLAFNSDSETAPPAFGGAGTIFLHEVPGGVYDATMYLNRDLQAQGFTAKFVSDAEVPEAASFAMMGLSLAGLTGLALRQRRRQRMA